MIGEYVIITFQTSGMLSASFSDTFVTTKSLNISHGLSKYRISDSGTTKKNEYNYSYFDMTYLSQWTQDVHTSVLMAQFQQSTTLGGSDFCLIMS